MKKIITLLFVLSLSSCFVYDSSIAGNYDDNIDYRWRYNYYWYPNTFYYRPYSRTIIVLPKQKDRPEPKPRVENINPRPYNPPSKENRAPIRTFPNRGRGH